MVVAAREAINRLPDGGRFVALDSLRGIAALLVVINHVPLNQWIFALPIIRHADYAVDFFFVLSGFVIAGAYARRLGEDFPLVRFLILRLGRIVPLHLFVLALWIVVRVGAALVAHRPFFNEHASLIELLMAVFLVHGFDNDSTLPWNGPTWSISVEIWMYLLFALLFRHFARRGLWVVPAALLTGAALLALATVDQFGTPVSEYMARGVAGFGLGTLCWRAWEAGLGERLVRLGKARLGVLQAGLLVLAFVCVAETYENYTLIGLLMAPLVLAMACGSGPVARFLALPPFLLLGTLSYSLYIDHSLLMVVGFGLIDSRMHLVAPGQADIANAVGVIAILLSVPMAWFTWKYVEWPARQWSRRKARQWGAGAAEANAPTM